MRGWLTLCILVSGLWLARAPGEEVADPTVTPRGTPFRTASQDSHTHDDDCTMCQGEERFACLRCEGDGRRDVPCTRCAGEKRVACPLVACDKGKLLCNPCGGAGYIEWKSGDRDACKVCAKKGSSKCGLCSGKGKVDCPDCERSGVRDVACSACLGVGSHPCPRASPSGCVVCQDQGHVHCQTCDGRGKLPQRCGTCYDFDRWFCPEDACWAGRLVCSRCYGCGVQRLVNSATGTEAGSSKCTECKGRGYESCKTCKKKGFINCEEKHQSLDCPDCNRGEVDCAACDGRQP